MTGGSASPLDTYEKRILRLLQEDASLSNAEFAAASRDLPKLLEC